MYIVSPKTAAKTQLRKCHSRNLNASLENPLLLPETVAKEHQRQRHEARGTVKWQRLVELYQ